MLTLSFFRSGAQGLLEGASKQTLENEFGTSKEDEAVLTILEKGSLQEFEVCCFLSASFSFLSSMVLSCAESQPSYTRPLRRHGWPVLCSVGG